jgi:2-iminobutanoate/2-iminopropanoate deaminase
MSGGVQDRATGGKHLPQSAVQHVTAGPYSPVLEVDPGRLVVLSGQVALALDGTIIGNTLEEQAAATLANCERLLASAHCGFADVFKVNVYLRDIGDWPAFNAVYVRAFPEPRPVRTAIQAVLLPGFLVELEMWAIKKRDA